MGHILLCDRVTEKEKKDILKDCVGPFMVFEIHKPKSYFEITPWWP